MPVLEIFVIDPTDIHLSPIYFWKGTYAYDPVAEIIITNNSGSYIPQGLMVQFDGDLGLNTNIQMGFSTTEVINDGQTSTVQLLLNGTIDHPIPTQDFVMTINHPA